ncbi:MAG: DinB family protein [Candidatus Solibacter usitatus]|nr:DinB family protein [Candidatus Solibacter usitatus]
MLGRIVLGLTVCAGLAPAQDVVAKNLTALFAGYRVNIMEALGKVKPEDYGFKPSPDVRTMREQFAHIADANYSICSGLKGEANPNTSPLEQKDLGKPELTKAVADSFDYCMAAMEGWSDAKFSEMVKRGTTERPKAYHALHLLEHTGLHYGNLVTYMRMKGMVPPETERRQQQARPAAAKQ